MRLANLCCGAVRPQSTEGVEWINIDHLHPVLHEGTEERKNLDAEPNYLEWDVESGPIPIAQGSLDGILASHCVEHWDCQKAVVILRDCWSLLKPGGILLVSVPNASYFRQVHEQDTVENAVELFGESIYLQDGERTFFGYGLWNRYHKAILTEDALWAYFRRAGFAEGGISRCYLGHDDRLFYSKIHDGRNRRSELFCFMSGFLNRIPFSLVMVGIKS